MQWHGHKLKQGSVVRILCSGHERTLSSQAVVMEVLDAATVHVCLLAPRTVQNYWNVPLVYTRATKQVHCTMLSGRFVGMHCTRMVHQYIGEVDDVNTLVGVMAEFRQQARLMFGQ